MSSCPFHWHHCQPPVFPDCQTEQTRCRIWGIIFLKPRYVLAHGAFSRRKWQGRLLLVTHTDISNIVIWAVTYIRARDLIFVMPGWPWTSCKTASVFEESWIEIPTSASNWTIGHTRLVNFFQHRSLLTYPDPLAVSRCPSEYLVVEACIHIAMCSTVCSNDQQQIIAVASIELDVHEKQLIMSKQKSLYAKHQS